MGTKATTTLRRRRLVFNLCAALAITGTAQAQTRAVHRLFLGSGAAARALTAEDFADASTRDDAAANSIAAKADPLNASADAQTPLAGPGYVAVPLFRSQPSAPAATAANPTYTYVGPGTGTNLFSVAANWSPAGPPVSGASTSLVFPAFDANSYTASNDEASLPTPASPFQLNNFTFQSYSTSNNNVTNSTATTGNQFQLTGASPTITQSGPGNFVFLGTGVNGLVLAPTSGTTTINGTGSGPVLPQLIISGTGGLDINVTGGGSTSTNGNVRLTGANTFTGNVVLDAGGLQVSNASALGNAANTLTVNGGTFSSTTSTSFNLANPVILNADLVYNTLTLALTGPVSGAGGIQLLNGSTFSQVSSLTLGGANTFTGAVTLQNGVPRFTTQGGTLTVASGSTVSSTGAITVGDNGIFALAGNTVHLPNNNPVVLNGGRLSVTGVSGGSAGETFGTLTTSGIGVILLNAGATSNTLAFGNYQPGANATLEVRGPFAGSATPTGKLTFANGLTNVSDPLAPGTTGQYVGVVPSVSGYSLATAATALNAFVKYDPTAGVTYVLNTDNTQVAQIGTSGVLDGTFAYKNVNLTAAASTTPVTVTGAQRINALSNSASTNVTGTGTLTVSSGAVIVGSNTLTLGAPATSTVAATGPTLDFGAATGYIHLGGGMALTGTSGITGSGGLVVSGIDAQTSGNGSGGGSFALTFNQVQTGVSASNENPFTGGLTVNGNAQVAFYRDGQLGAPGGAITLNGGGLNLKAATTGAAVVVSRPLNIGAAGGNVYANNLAGNSLTFSGAVTGAGTLSVGDPANNPSGPIELTGGTSGFTGAIDLLAQGVLVAASDAELGSLSSPLNLAGGTVQFTASGTFSKPMATLGLFQNTLNTGANNVTLATPLAGTDVSPSAGIVKTGTGALTLSGGASSYAGPIFVAQGTLALGGGTALNQVTSLVARAGTGATPLGGTIAGSGSVGGTLNVNAASTVASVRYSGGTLNPGDPAVPNSTGILSARRLTMGSTPALGTADPTGATFVADLNGTTMGSLYDDVTVSNLITLGGSTLQINVGFVPQAGQQFTIINNTGANAVVGTFANLPEGTEIVLANNNAFYISYVGGPNGDSVVLTDVPEPGTTARMLIGGAALLAGAAWRRLRRV